jgi:hypothetical protein
MWFEVFVVVVVVVDATQHKDVSRITGVTSFTALAMDSVFFCASTTVGTE